MTAPLIVPLLLLCCRYIKWDGKAFLAGLAVSLSITAAIVIGTGGVGAILSALEWSSGVFSIEALSALGIALWGSGAGILLIVLGVEIYAFWPKKMTKMLFPKQKMTNKIEPITKKDSNCGNNGQHSSIFNMLHHKYCWNKNDLKNIKLLETSICEKITKDDCQVIKDRLNQLKKDIENIPNTNMSGKIECDSYKPLIEKRLNRILTSSTQRRESIVSEIRYEDIAVDKKNIDDFREKHFVSNIEVFRGCGTSGIDFFEIGGIYPKEINGESNVDDTTRRLPKTLNPINAHYKTQQKKLLCRKILNEEL